MCKVNISAVNTVYVLNIAVCVCASYMIDLRSGLFVPCVISELNV